MRLSVQRTATDFPSGVRRLGVRRQRAEEDDVEDEERSGHVCLRQGW
jgi:hypothetical protein